MGPSVTAALRLKQMLKQCLKLSDADITAQQPNSVPGQAVVCPTFPPP